ncbi:cyclic GMP-AMP phosphodiesterase SMPDL3A-like isoform X2 [Clytia hemisphaerica]
MNQTDGYKVNFTEGSAPYWRVHCDSPYKLVQSSADYIKTLNEASNVKAQFILLSGNNDIPLHYNPPVEHPESFYGDLSKEVTKYIFPKSSVLAELNSVKEFNESFLQGGYYAVNVSEFLQLITLSTNYWNSRCFTINPSITTIGDRQMKWLENTFKTAAASNKKVLVSGHIPAGISAYKDEGSFWLKNYTTVYVKLMTDFADIITLGQFYGHAHKDKIKIQNVHNSFYPNTQPSIPKAFLLMSPSITPIQGNNAAFRLFTLSKDLELSDYTQYYMDFILANVFSKPSWKKEYTFSECYGASISAKSIQDIVQNVISSSDNSTWVRYMTHMRTLYGGFSTEVMFREYCGAQHFTLEAYLACVKYYETNGF